MWANAQADHETVMIGKWGVISETDPITDKRNVSLSILPEGATLAQREGFGIRCKSVELTRARGHQTQPVRFGQEVSDGEETGSDATSVQS